MKRLLLVTSVAAICSGVFSAYAVDPVPTPPAPTNIDQGSGKVDFVGQVIDAPCSVEANDGKPVDMGSVSVISLTSRKRSESTPFNINLRDCDASANGKTVSVTFTGSGAFTPTGTSPNVLGVAGSAQNIGLVLQTGNGQQIVLGQPTEIRKITAGNQDMSFAAYVVPTSLGADDKSGAPVAGNYNSTANFTLTYQ